MGRCIQLTHKGSDAIIGKLANKDSFTSNESRQKFVYAALGEQLGVDVEPVGRMTGSEAIFARATVPEYSEKPLLFKLGWDAETLRNIAENKTGFMNMKNWDKTTCLAPEPVLLNRFYIGMEEYDGNIENILLSTTRESRPEVTEMMNQLHTWFTSRDKKHKSILSAQADTIPRAAQEFVHNMFDKIRYCLRELESMRSAPLEDGINREVEWLVSYVTDVSKICGKNTPVLLKLGWDWNPRNIVYKKVNDGFGSEEFDFARIDIQGDVSLPPFIVGYLDYMLKVHDMSDYNRIPFIDKLKANFVGKFDTESGTWEEYPLDSTWSSRNDEDKSCDTHVLYKLGYTTAKSTNMRYKGRSLRYEMGRF